MADFKKTPDGDSVGPAEVFGLDRIPVESILQFIATFWPAIIGGIALFVLVITGRERAAIGVAAAMVLLQAGLLGLFG